MAQYYYTVSSLPAIRFEEHPFLSQEEFLQYCEIEVTPQDLAVIQAGQIWASEEAESPLKNEVLNQWNRTLREIQLQAAIIRAQALGRDTDRIPRPDVQDAGLPERLRQILNEDTPLKTENALLRMLWQHADSLEVGHHFDREKLLVYHLKLQIATRRARINDSEQGNDEFERQYEEVAQSLMEIAT